MTNHDERFAEAEYENAKDERREHIFNGNTDVVIHWVGGETFSMAWSNYFKNTGQGREAAMTKGK